MQPYYYSSSTSTSRTSTSASSNSNNSSSSARYIPPPTMRAAARTTTTLAPLSLPSLLRRAIPHTAPFQQQLAFDARASAVAGDAVRGGAYDFGVSSISTTMSASTSRGYLPYYGGAEYESIRPLSATRSTFAAVGHEAAGQEEESIIVPSHQDLSPIPATVTASSSFDLMAALFPTSSASFYAAPLAPQHQSTPQHQHFFVVDPALNPKSDISVLSPSQPFAPARSSSFVGTASFEEIIAAALSDAAAQRQAGSDEPTLSEMKSSVLHSASSAEDLLVSSSSAAAPSTAKSKEEEDEEPAQESGAATTSMHDLPRQTAAPAPAPAAAVRLPFFGARLTRSNVRDEEAVIRGIGREENAIVVGGQIDEMDFEDDDEDDDDGGASASRFKTGFKIGAASHNSTPIAAASSLTAKKMRRREKKSGAPLRKRARRIVQQDEADGVYSSDSDDDDAQEEEEEEEDEDYLTSTSTSSTVALAAKKKRGRSYSSATTTSWCTSTPTPKKLPVRSTAAGGSIVAAPKLIASGRTSWNDGEEEEEEEGAKKKKGGESKEKRFICDECGVGFARMYNLQTHAKNHQGFKGFACPVDGCDKWFSRKHDRTRHGMTIHKMTI